MAVRPTKTNPSGSRMETLRATLPIGDVEHLKAMSKATNKPMPVLLREAVRAYIERYYLSESP